MNQLPLTLFLTLLVPNLALAQQPAPPAQIEFFEKRVRPLLVKHCYECHSQSAKKVQGKLLLDSFDGVRKGGRSGPAIIPGKVKDSLLLVAVRHEEKDLRMPPKTKLARGEIADLEKWVAMGAPYPRDSKASLPRKQGEIDLIAAKQFWSFQPVKATKPPHVKNASWPITDIDRFILAKLEANGLTPVDDADARTLLRRATFDLIGLPPTPAEVDEFVKAWEAPGAQRPALWAKTIDRLLASPAYGERWGRHWLDVVRYADTAGDNSDYPVPQMYLYRNWVIDAFNRDMPYDQFVTMQLAGDLLPKVGRIGNPAHDAIIATGYLANSRRHGSYEDKRYPWHLTIEDTIDNFGKTFLGLTIHCCRCHDHKFDPLPQEDYYALYGFFSSTRYPRPGIELDRVQRDLIPLSKKAMAYAVIDGKNEKDKRSGRVGNVKVQIKGDPDRPGKEVPRRFPLVLGGQTLPTSVKGSGRLELAKWTVDPANPLTARVMVNRIWQYHFGSGIVPTANNFGKQGQSPTHPELLDYLAKTFIDRGWSIKQMHRAIMRSRVYQLASADHDGNLKIDIKNEFHWRFSRRRLDAEEIRDALLSVSGNLDRSPGGPHPFPEMKAWNFTQHQPFKAVYASNRRSVYLMTQRIARHPFLALFDGPDTNASTAERTTTTTPLQALFLMNDPFVHEQARKLGARLMKEEKTDAGRIERAFVLAYARPPSAEERVQAGDYLTQVAAKLRGAGLPADQARTRAWESFARVLFMSNEFAYVN